MKSKHLASPVDRELLRSLKAGDEVLLSGSMITGRDAAHKNLAERIKSNKKLPVDVKDEIIFFVGPTPAKKGAAIGAAGPTTSSRMDKYSPDLLKRGLAGMIGKGRRSREVVDAIIKYKAVYFVTYGGAGAFLSKRIKKSLVIAYPELGTEAIRRIEVKDFPAVVAIDSKGGMIDSMK